MAAASFLMVEVVLTLSAIGVRIVLSLQRRREPGRPHFTG